MCGRGQTWFILLILGQATNSELWERLKIFKTCRTRGDLRRSEIVAVQLKLQST